MRIERFMIMLCAATLSASAVERGDSAVAALERTVAVERDGLWRLARGCYANPAVNQWRMEGSLTRIGAAFGGRSDSGETDPRAGSGAREWSAGADTYTKYRSSTLWGDARYSNGVTDDGVWCETADSQLLYPYLTADAAGGDINHETYRFGGGYADHAGRWAWGVSAGYEARLEYRTVDPRPRNVTGTLDIAVGGAVRLYDDVYAAVGVSWRMYKQSNDISFKSEMGVEKIYHLTGMATHYSRFDGNSLSVNYRGNRYGVELAVYPSGGRGWFASCSLGRFEFDNILTDLNKLPMAHVWENTLAGQAGWLSPGDNALWGVSASVDAGRRHGIENIFGDPASSIYPQIGSLTMYGRNYVRAGAAGRYTLLLGSVTRVGAEVSAGYYRMVEAYVQPRRHTLLRGADMSVTLSGDVALGRGWMLSASAGASATAPSGCSRTWVGTGTDAAMAPLEAIEERVYEMQSHSIITGQAEVSVVTPAIGRVNLQVGGGWQRVSYTGPAHRDSYRVGVAVLF